MGEAGVYVRARVCLSVNTFCGYAALSGGAGICVSWRTATVTSGEARRFFTASRSDARPLPGGARVVAGDVAAQDSVTTPLASVTWMR